MNLFKKSMIFITFFGCCLALSLLAASLGTDYWTITSAKRIVNGKPDDSSSGHINFGLFNGKKQKNVGLGTRELNIYVPELIRTEPGLMIYGLWIATVATISCGMLFAVIGAIFAVINTATNPIETVTGVPGLFIWNYLALMFDTAAFACWIVQYYLRLKENVMTQEERDFNWTSKDMVIFGFSFWLVVVAAFAHCVNIVVLHVGTREPRRKKIRVPVNEEKSNAAIMLF